jgi:hypothetical protein
MQNANAVHLTLQMKFHLIFCWSNHFTTKILNGPGCQPLGSPLTDAGAVDVSFLCCDVHDHAASFLQEMNQDVQAHHFSLRDDWMRLKVCSVTHC